MNEPEEFRRTGRTYRMLIKVIGHVLDEGKILVICPNMILAKYMADDFGRMLPSGIKMAKMGTQIRFDGGASVLFVSEPHLRNMGEKYWRGFEGQVAMDHACENAYDLLAWIRAEVKLGHVKRIE